MTQRSATHATFVIERSYAASPSRVFSAWADKAKKAQWAACHQEFEFDFRVGGRELSRGGDPGGPVYSAEVWYRDIVPDQRIVYSYTLDVDDTRVSVSLVTVEFAGHLGGTRLTYTEQGVHLDGHDTPAQREHGTREGLARLEDLVEGAVLTLDERSAG